MKKVGILSMQRIANYGSFLQAYGLKSILEELGCQVQFVDYRIGTCLVEADGGYGIGCQVPNRRRGVTSLPNSNS